MESAPQHPQEQQRLTSLLRYEILDTDAEAAFDDLTELASTLCGTPISLISLIDEHRQWFKSRVGLQASETERSIAFCSHAILQEKIFEVPNATQDHRFHDNPLVTGAPDIRFYAGAPLVTPEGQAIGTLCVIDREPKHLTNEQRHALEVLSRQVIAQLELRLHNRRLKRINREQQSLFATISHDLRSPFNVILGMAKRLSDKAPELTPDRIVTLSNGVLNGAMRAYELLDELLQWSSRRYAQHAITLNKHFANELLSNSHELLEEALASKGITLVKDIDSELALCCDAVLTRAILRNLLNNAIKYSPAGAEIVVAARRVNERVEISVSDRGEGIPPEQQTSLFGDTQESRQGTHGEKGCGLGLVLCGEMVQAQGANIWLDTRYTQGTRIVVSFIAAP